MEITKKDTNEWVDFFSIVIRNYRLILVFVVLSCLAAVIITYLIPKQYTSSAIVFPTDSNSLDEVIKNPQFGYDVEADRLIQLLESKMIRDSIINKFHLLKYYEIDETDNDKDYQLTKKYLRDIEFTKTPFMSVVISARSRNPQMAADIVNEIVSLIGEVREKLLKSNVNNAIPALQYECNTQKSDLDSLGRVLDGLLRNKNDAKQYVQTDKMISVISDKKLFENDEAGKALQLMVNQYNLKLSSYFDVQNKLKNALLMSRRPLPSVYVIEPAVASYKKSYPKYSVNLLFTFTGSSIFISFFLFFIQKIKSLKFETKFI